MTYVVLLYIQYPYSTYLATSTGTVQNTQPARFDCAVSANLGHVENDRFTLC